eukprot:jgi/Chrzof1/12121/Cz06g22010.t1
MMRGRDEVAFRRGGSPGRWGESPGRPARPKASASLSRSRSPARRPGAWGFSRSRSRSRSRSPLGRGPPYRGPPGRHGSPGYSPPPPTRAGSPPFRGRPPPPRRGYSASPSRSYSGSGSESDEGAVRQPPLPGHRRKKVLQVKQRERTFKDQLSNLEEQLQQEHALRNTAEAKVGFLTDKLKTVGERSRDRGSMLLQLVTAFRKVDTCKQQLQEAEAELGAITQLAVAMMQGQDQAYQRMGEAAADGGPDVKTEPESSRGEPGPVGPAAATALAAAEQETANGALPTEQPQPPNPSTAAADTAATEAAPEGQVQREAQAASTGGWMEASSNAADAKPGGSPGKFRPFTFKIKL